MKARSISLAIACLGLAASAKGALLEAAAGQANVTISGHTLVFSRKDEDAAVANRNLMLHETSVRGGYYQYNLGADFSSQLPITKGADANKPFTLEKKYVTADWDHWELDLGDSHVELGKGLALSLYRDPVFGIDNTVEGANLRYSDDTVKVGAFVGRVNELKVPVAVNPVLNSTLERNVYLAGGDIKGKVGGGVTAGAHYLFSSQQSKADGTFDRYWNTIGASLSREGADDGIDAYLESNVLLTKRQTETTSDMLPTGYGTYGSVSFVPAPWKFKLEAKDYRDYRFEFRRPPTLEEDIVETVNTQDVSAGKLSAEYRFLEAGAFTRVSYLLGDDRQKSAAIHHGVVAGGFKGPGRTAFELSAGYRYMPAVADLTHAAVKAKVPTFDGQSVEVGVRRLMNRTDIARVPVRDDKQIVDLTYNFSSKFNLGAGVEVVPTNAEDVGKYFFNASATLKLGAFMARAFAGSTSGGTMCSGGVCRQVPKFSGGSLESTYSF